jgi:hypothetical protein
MVDNPKPKRIRATDSAISTQKTTTTFNKLKFCRPITNLIKMFGIETRVLSYEAHRTTISTILHFNLLKSAGLQRRIHKSRLIMNVKKNRYLRYSFAYLRSTVMYRIKVASCSTEINWTEWHGGYWE